MSGKWSAKHGGLPVAEIVANSLDELHAAIRANPSYIVIRGDIAQKISQALNAYYKFKRTQHTCAAAGATAAGAICFGPVGWLASGVSTGVLLLALKRKEAAEKELRSVPYSSVAESIADAKYEILSNDGERVTLCKK